MLLPVEGVVNVLAHLPLDQLDDQARASTVESFACPPTTTLSGDSK